MADSGDAWQDWFEIAADAFTRWLFEETCFRMWDEADLVERERWREYVRGVMRSTPGANTASYVEGLAEDGTPL